MGSGAQRLAPRRAAEQGRPRYGEGRNALLEAAIRVTARCGLRGLTYRAVAAEARISHGAVTHHFGSRDAMIRQALAYSADTAIGLSSLEPGTGQIEDFVTDLTAVVDENPDSQAFQFELALESRRDESLTSTSELYQPYVDATRRELERMGFDADPAFARMVFATLDGLVFQQVTGAIDAQEAEAAVRQLRKMLLGFRQHTRHRSDAADGAGT